MKYYCGWDGGGSKTHVCVTDEAGQIIAEKAFGPLNLNGTSEDTVAQTIRNCVDFMLSLPYGIEDCQGLVIGVAGISNPHSAEYIEAQVRQKGYNGILRLMGDNEIALAGAVSGHGAILIAGTGSVCLLRDKYNNIHRCGGYGHLIDDEGSGYAIGRDILIAVTQAFDGRARETCLTEAVYKHLGISSHSELVAWVYSPERDKKDIAALAPLLIPAIEDGDKSAVLIEMKASAFLSHLVTSTFKKAELEAGELALMGSIFEHYHTIRQGVTDIIKRELPNVNLVTPRHTPAQGAALLAIEIFS